MNIKTLLSIFIISYFSSMSFAQSTLDMKMGASSKYTNVKIQKVLNADTIYIETIRKSGEKFKLIGLKAPEPPPYEKEAERDKFGRKIKKPVSPIRTIEEQALDFAQELLEGKDVRLEFDSNKRDKNFDAIVYVFIDPDLLEDAELLPCGTCVYKSFNNKSYILANTEIVRHGFANLRLDPTNRKYIKELRAAYKEARSEKRGLHGN